MVKPGTPEHAVVRKKHRAFELSWENADNNRMFVVYKLSKKANLNIENPEHIYTVTNEKSLIVDSNKNTRLRKYRYAVTAISPSHHESGAVEFKK